MASVVLLAGCDMPLVSVELELSEVCVTHTDVRFEPTVVGAEQYLDVQGLEPELSEQLETSIHLSHAALAVTSADPTGSERVVVSLRGMDENSNVLVPHTIFDSPFGADSGTTAVEATLDPPLEVSDYWHGRSAELVIAVSGQWSQSWSASVDLCVEVAAAYEQGWP